MPRTRDCIDGLKQEEVRRQQQHLEAEQRDLLERLQHADEEEQQRPNVVVDLADHMAAASISQVLQERSDSSSNSKATSQMTLECEEHCLARMKERGIGRRAPCHPHPTWVPSC